MMQGQFDTHIKKFHKDIFNHLCKKCDHGFITLNALNKHKIQHNKKAEKIKCGQDRRMSEFLMKDSLKNHQRKHHPVGGIKDMPCSFANIGCTKTFKMKSN